MTSPVEFFPRRTSGLVRVMSPASAWAYNVLTMGVIFPWVFFWGPAAFPNGNLWIGILAATLFQLPISSAYARLAATFPRSGGDYVFQSRILGGAVGFVSVFSGFVVWILLWVALSGWLMSVLAIAPLFLGLGYAANSTTLRDIGLWCQSPNGIVTISLFQVLATTVFLNRGFKSYVILQWLLLALTLVAFALVVEAFRDIPAASLGPAIDTFAAWISASAPASLTASLVAGTPQEATAFGLRALATLGIAPIAWTSLQWATYSVEQGAEISRADSVVAQRRMLVWSAVFVGVLLALLAYLEERALGAPLLRGLARAYQLGEGDSSAVAMVQALRPMPNVLVLALRPGVVVVVLIALGYAANSFQITCNCLIGVSRILVGMSMDRTVPQTIGTTDPATASPVRAHWAYAIASVPVILLYNYLPSWASLTLGVTLACGYVFVLSTLAAAKYFFSRYKQGDASAGRSAATAVVGSVTGTAMIVGLVALPAYGLRQALGLGVVFGVIALAALWYLVAKQAAKRNGFDLSILYQQMPPE